MDLHITEIVQSLDFLDANLLVRISRENRTELRSIPHDPFEGIHWRDLFRWCYESSVLLAADLERFPLELLRIGKEIRVSKRSWTKLVSRANLYPPDKVINVLFTSLDHNHSRIPVNKGNGERLRCESTLLSYEGKSSPWFRDSK